MRLYRTSSKTSMTPPKAAESPEASTVSLPVGPMANRVPTLAKPVTAALTLQKRKRKMNQRSNRGY